MERRVKYTNILDKQTSAYLLQHATNPVAWQPWTDESFEKAKERDVPVFLSIGYSTCHWCHVMAHESFEDLSVAEFLNEHFVCIKVDREERPDVDAICMDVCQATTGHGGWPLTVMMDANRRPFFAGTYFPRYSQQGRIGFLDLAKQISNVWINERSRIETSATTIIDALLKGAKADHQGVVSEDVFTRVADYHLSTFDKAYAGFGDAPKFPSPHHLILLLRIAARESNAEAKKIAMDTLRAMRSGGIYDQVGFGFHRYSTDRRWQIPHFEKMLYDQAMHIMAYTEGWQSSHQEFCKKTVFELVEFVETTMTLPSGAFFSAIDADSDGREGAYYLYTHQELLNIHSDLSADGCLGKTLGVTLSGNYRDEATGNSTGENILYVADQNLEELFSSPTWHSTRKTILEFRNSRPKPFIDTKVLADWNGLMIVALAKAARVFGDESMLRMAIGAYVAVQPRREFLDDNAMMAWAGIELFQTTGEQAYLEDARCIAQHIETSFARDGVLYQVTNSVTDIPVQPRQAYDGAYPCGNSVAAMVFVLLGVLLKQPDWIATATKLVRQYAKQIQTFPSGYCMLLAAWDLIAHDYMEVTLFGSQDTQTLLQKLEQLHDTYAPWTIVNHKHGQTDEYLVCTPYACELPLQTMSELRDRLTVRQPA